MSDQTLEQLIILAGDRFVDAQEDDESVDETMFLANEPSMQEILRLGPSVAEALIEIADSWGWDSEYASAAAYALSQVCDAEVIVTNVADRERDTLRWHRERCGMPARFVFQAVGHNGRRLARVLENPDTAVRHLAVDALAVAKDKRTGRKLVEIALSEQDDYVCYAAVEALRPMITRRQLDRFVHELQSEDSHRSYAAESALLRLNDPRSVDLLAALLSQGSPPSNYRAIRILGKLSDTAAVPALMHILRDDDDWARSETVEALANIGEAALARLESGKLDSDRNILAAADALISLGDARAHSGDTTRRPFRPRDPTRLHQENSTAQTILGC